MMWKPVTLPYHSNSLSVPALPTVDEIRACTNILWDCRSYKVVAVDDEVVVKYGTSLDPCEGQSLIYLERDIPDVPAPRLYAMFHHSNELFIVMQHVPGDQLDKIWSSLTECEKDDICGKLRLAFDAMRKAECPDFYGNTNGGGVQHYLFYNQQSPGRYLGPFPDEASFVAGMIGNYRSVILTQGLPDFKARYYEKHLDRVLRGHRPSFTHGDVQQKNILVAENKERRNSQGGRSFDVALVDWENSGWYPEYWEFFCAAAPIRFTSTWEHDWCWRAQEILEVWPAEWAVMRMIDRDFVGY